MQRTDDLLAVGGHEEGRLFHHVVPDEQAHVAVQDGGVHVVPLRQRRCSHLHYSQGSFGQGLG